MRIGLGTILIGDSIDIVELAPRVEELGFDSIWTPEQPTLPVVTEEPIPREWGDIPDPFVLLSRAAAVTTTLKLGTAVCVVTERHPITLAKEVATLSAASEAPATSPAGVVQFRQALVETIAEITTDPDATTTVLTSEAAGAAASGHYLYSEDAEAGLLVVAGLPPLPLGAVYQIWLEDSLRAVSGGVFTAEANGEQTVLVETEALLLPRRISVRVAQGGAESAPEGLLILSGDMER